MRVTPDDEVYRVNTVWLGPTGLTFPWTARYLAYAMWLVVFLVILFVEAVTPLHVNVPPIWEICLATLFTYGLMGFIDHERPFGAVWQTFIADLTSPRPGTKPQRMRVQPAVRVRERPRRPVRRHQVGDDRRTGPTSKHQVRRKGRRPAVETGPTVEPGAA